ncbi:MAG: hypothetical protein U9Q61_08370 [Thermodesulfobacteriota bacterium]|nr:hypothetical protein [Thermodesulfobacteriota bacterium]
MRIINSYIPEQPKLSTPGARVSSADQAGTRQRIQQAKDSYSKNAASAQVIDAEYVDLYNPDTVALQQECQDLNLTLEPETALPPKESETDPNINSIINKYQMAPLDIPHPGTYLNIFA